MEVSQYRPSAWEVNAEKVELERLYAERSLDFRRLNPPLFVGGEGMHPEMKHRHSEEQLGVEQTALRLL